MTAATMPRALLWLWTLMFATSVLAVDNVPPLPDARLQQRYYTLTHELRCMQCQNEALADSPVGLAADLRLQVRELLLVVKPMNRFGIIWPLAMANSFCSVRA